MILFRCWSVRRLQLASFSEAIPSKTEEASFRTIGISAKLRNALKCRGIDRPTAIQQKAIKPILNRRRNLLIHSETGTGKTLAFLLPCLQDNRSNGNLPSSLVMAPTRELVLQLSREAWLMEDKGFNDRKTGPIPAVSLVSGTNGNTRQLDAFMKQSPKIVIGTPKMLVSVIDDHPHLFKGVKRVILDDVDKMLDPLHPLASRRKRQARERHPRPGSQAVQLLRNIAGPKKPQFVCATATVKDGLVDELETLLDCKMGMVTVTGRNTVPPNIHHGYVVSVEDSDHSKVVTLCNAFADSEAKSALVFLHKEASVDLFVSKLQTLGVNAGALWKYAADSNSRDFEQFLSDFQSGAIEMVVATEETVRGLDFPWLTHVYLMDVPRSAEDYLHLGGRVGRQGKEGQAIVILQNKESDIFRQLKMYNKLGVTGHEIQTE